MPDSSDLYHCLSTHGALSSLVGGAIYPMVAPQDQKPPYIVYTPISSIYFASAACGIPDGYPSFQIDVYAQRVAEVDGIVREYISALRNSSAFKPRIISDEGVRFESGSELFRHSADYRLW